MAINFRIVFFFILAINGAEADPPSAGLADG